VAALTVATGTVGIITMRTDVTIIATTGTVEIITVVTIGTAGITTTVTTGIKEITELKGQTVLTSQIATGATRADGVNHHNQTVTIATATVVIGVDGDNHHNQTETITEVTDAHQTMMVAATEIVEVATTTVNLLKTEATRVVHIAREGSKIISPTYIKKAITLTADGFLLLLKIRLSRCWL
jgi:hypothetical protein